MRRRARTLDVAASALAHVLPRPLARAIDQARLDAASILDGLSGRRTPSFSTREAPIVPPTALDTIDPVYEILPDGLARHWATIARDVRTVTSELRGDRMPAVVLRPKRVATQAPAPLPQRRTLVVRSLVHETSDALAIELADPIGRPITFTPGQFLTLHVTIDGRELRRAYSIASTPESPTATIVVKKIENGLVSGHLHRTLRVGDTIDVTGPSGSFVVPPSTAPRHLVLFAGGSGITPMLSILRTALASEPGTRVTLVFGNRRASDIIFAAQLDALARESSRLRVVHVLEEAAERAHHLGRPDAETIRTLLDAYALRDRMPGEDAPLFFVCGPAAMMSSVRRALSDAGILDARIREERFLSPADPTTRVDDLPKTPQPITVRRRGALRTFLQQPGETILDAANRAGADLPSSCTMGGCGACRCRAVSGEVAVDAPSCLTDAERAEGFVLTCVGRARGPVTLEVP